jgi:transcriptional regulator with XRE-family HTH domain
MSQNLLGEFLRARRELTHPEEHGIPDLGHRRVPGLRREEVAILAGISVEYYVRLERGRDRHPSEQVISELARVLSLDSESRQYLASLAAPAGRRRSSTPHTERAHPPAQRLLAHLRDVPSLVLGQFMDVLAYNRAAELLFGRPLEGNMIRYVFLDPQAREIYPDWGEVAAESVAALRSSAAGHLDDPRLVGLVGELSLKSADFRLLWARHDVRAKTTGSKRISSPTVGAVTVIWESLAVTSAPGQLLVTYLAADCPESREALRRVAAIAITQPTQGATA